MFSSLANGLRFLRGRWRWIRGRCPLCNRNLYAVFAYYMADYPNCPVCQTKTAADARLWRKYRNLVTVQTPTATG
jgi:hypothetical protein